jgi:release factor glutamine methyltransferase
MIAAGSPTLLIAWKSARDRLIAAGVDTPVIDARLLVEAATGVTRLEIVTDPYRELCAEAVNRLEALLARRAAREPVAQILGYRDFRKHRFAVSSAVLTPRPETELLVEAALEMLPVETPRSVVDLGVGSGAILLSILAERPLAQGVGVDVSEDALAVALRNVEALQLAAQAVCVCDDWGAGLAEGAFDLAVSNPPYVRSAALSLLEPEVARWEPALALDGGRDGLEAYRRVMPAIRRLVRPGGSFAVELGQGQAEAVWAYADREGLRPDGVREDLAGIPRVLYGRRL